VNLPLNLLNTLPDERAQMEAAEQVLYRLQCLDLGTHQAEYLNAWQHFYADNQHYLFPDDRAATEYTPPRLEDVSALSYERTAHAVKQTRQDVLQGNKERLGRELATATQPTTYRQKLAHTCHATATLLAAYADVFADLTAATYTPCLPPIFSSRPERRVDEPATVGAALGLVDFLAYACAEYKTSQSTDLTTAPPPATPAIPNPAAELFAPLLLNYTLAELTALLRELELLDPTTGRPTPAASPGTWVGVIYALLEADCPRLKYRKAAAQRAFVNVFGAVVSESAIHTGLGKRGSESELFRNRALALLNR